MFCSQDFALRAAALASKMKFNKCVPPSGELWELKEERRAVYPQQPTRASVGLENMHLTFDGTIASSAESAAVQTPWRHRSKVNNTADGRQPAGTSTACSWSGRRRWVVAQPNTPGQEGRPELCFPPSYAMALQPLAPTGQGHGLSGS